jgi:hypothetical protein
MHKLLLTLLGLVAGLARGLTITRPYPVTGEARAQETASELDRFIAAFERIRTGYVDQIDQSQLIDAAIKGMVGMLDSQSGYITWPLFRDMQVSFRHLVGPGMEFIAEKGYFKALSGWRRGPGQVVIGDDCSRQLLALRCRLWRCDSPDIDTHSLPALSEIISPWRRREIHNRTPNVGMLRS